MLMMNRTEQNRTEQNKPKKTRQKKPLFSKAFLLLLPVALFGCEPSQQAPNSGEAKAVTTFKDYFQTQDRAVTQGIEAIANYIDLDLADKNSISTKAAIQSQTYTLDEIDKLLPHNLNTLNRAINTTSDTVSLGTELDAIAAQYKAKMAALAPDPTDALTLSGIERVATGIHIGGGVVIDPRTPEGSVTVEILNAFARGEDVEPIIQQLEIAGNSLTDNTITDVSSRGLYTGCNLLAPWNYCTKKWVNGIIYYYWIGMTGEHRTAMQTAMNDWETQTGGAIQFKYYYSQSNFHHFLTAIGLRSAVDFTTKDLPLNVNGQATIGSLPGMIPTLKLKTGITGDDLLLTARHELGHVIGQRHEHQRWDRDRYVTIANNGSNFDKIDRQKTYSWHFLAFRKVRIRRWWGSFTYWVPYWKKYTYNIPISYTTPTYDCNSVMHYRGLQTKINCGSYLAQQVTNTQGNMNITDLDVQSVLSRY